MDYSLIRSDRNLENTFLFCSHTTNSIVLLERPPLLIYAKWKVLSRNRNLYLIEEISIGKPILNEFVIRAGDKLIAPHLLSRNCGSSVYLCESLFYVFFVFSISTTHNASCGLTSVIVQSTAMNCRFFAILFLQQRRW